MKSLLLVVIASSVWVSKGGNHHNHKVLDMGKPSKNQVKLRNPSAKRGRISTTPKPSGGEKAYHYLIETSHGNSSLWGIIKRKHKIIKVPTEENKLEDYQNEEWENKCSLKAAGTKKKQLDIPGCGGWVKLACPGGCLAIHKVSRHKYSYSLRGSQDKAKYKYSWRVKC